MMIEVLVSGVIGAAFGASGGAIAAGVVASSKFDRLYAIADSAASVVVWIDERERSGGVLMLDPELRARIESLRKNVIRIR